MTVRKVTEAEIRAIRNQADKGPSFSCDCESSPELCTCSTIMMICDELLEARGFSDARRVYPDGEQGGTE